MNHLKTGHGKHRIWSCPKCVLHCKNQQEFYKHILNVHDASKEDQAEQQTQECETNGQTVDQQTIAPAINDLPPDNTGLQQGPSSSATPTPPCACGFKVQSLKCFKDSCLVNMTGEQQYRQHLDSIHGKCRYYCPAINCYTGFRDR